MVLGRHHQEVHYISLGCETHSFAFHCGVYLSCLIFSLPNGAHPKRGLAKTTSQADSIPSHPRMFFKVIPRRMLAERFADNLDMAER